MAKKPEVVKLKLSERLRESHRQATSMSLPLAVHHKLDVLAAKAEDAEATRAEIVGMLIAVAGEDVEGLEHAIMRYRKMTVGDVIKPDAPDEIDVTTPASNVVSIEKHGPGRRAGSRTA
jgi:hypothetical protein